MKKTLIALLVAGIAGAAGIGLMASEDHDEHERKDARYGEYGDRVAHEGDGRDRDGQDARLFREDTGDGFSDAGYLRDDRYVLYRAECGDCHMAYPPGMLPAVSWQATMATLDDHFGENAELDLATRAQLGNFLGDHAAGQGRGDYAERMWRATRGMAAPLRITETDYFVGKHHEIPLAMVKDNPEVRSFSRCEACHVRAGEGSFDEHEVRIAGHGAWDD